MSERSEYWSQHLAAIEREGIATKAYAEREGLSVAALYAWRRELKSRSVPVPVTQKRFVAVEVTGAGRPVPCRLRLGGGVELELSTLPDPEWLAELHAALTKRGH